MKCLPQIIKRLAAGIVVATILQAISSWIIASTIINGLIIYETLKYYILLILILSSSIGTAIILGKGDGTELKLSVLFSVILWSILISFNLLLFEGNFEGVIETLVVVTGSSVATALLVKHLRHGYRSKYYTKRNR